MHVRGLCVYLHHCYLMPCPVPSLREIPTVAVPGNPNDPARETKFPIASYSSPVPPTEAETYRHSIAGWHSLLSPDDVVTEHELPLPTGMYQLRSYVRKLNTIFLLGRHTQRTRSAR
jgi:hypothetical protein